ncbi:MAG: hypothetical protein JKY29_13450, partial [Gammaproteobacteria bacterium]|nr:hypothetical protein [Gammaproteobacteria bacterium]
MKELLVLSPVDLDNNKPTKILDKKLNMLQSFNSGFKFNFEIVEYETIHDAMKTVFFNQSCFMVLGELTAHGNDLYSSNKAGPRRKKKGRPTIQDRDGTEIVLDLDDHILKGFDPLKPVPAIKKWLAKRKIKCNVTWQITSGQKLKDRHARIRLYFETNKKLSLLDRKAWSQSPE